MTRTRADGFARVPNPYRAVKSVSCVIWRHVSAIRSAARSRSSSDTISFGQALVPEVIDRAMKSAAEADMFLAVGSTLQVYPVAGAVPIAREAGARVVILNNQPTPMDELADAVVREPIGEVLPALCAT